MCRSYPSPSQQPVTHVFAETNGQHGVGQLDAHETHGHGDDAAQQWCPRQQSRP